MNLKLNQYLIFILLPFLFSVTARSQETDPALIFQKLSVRDGLSNSSVYSLFQDKEGFVWIGTADGLNRYDGYNFTWFEGQLPYSSTLTGEMITSIDADQKGNLWFGIQFGGIVSWKDGLFKSYLINPGDPGGQSNNVWVIKADSLNRIWVGTNNNGLFLFDQLSGSFTPVLNSNILKDIPCNNITSLILDHNGNIMVATGDGRMYRIEKQSLRIQPFLPVFKDEEKREIKNINVIFEDSRKYLWIGTGKDGFYILQQNGTVREHIEKGNRNVQNGSDNIRCFVEDHSGTVWIGTDGGGLFIYNPDNHYFENVYHSQENPQSLSSNVIFALMKSRDGLIWAGTNKGGLNYYDPKRESFNTPGYDELPPARSLNYKVLISVFEDLDGNTWFGTDGGGLNLFRKKDRQLFLFKNIPGNQHSISGNAVKSLFQDQSGRIFAGTYGNGLNLYRPLSGDFQRIPTKGEPEAHDIWDISEDSQGNLWIATLNDGLFRLDKGKKYLEPLRDRTTAVGEHLFCLLWDSVREGLWIGTNQGLKFLDNETGNVRSWAYNRDDSLATSGNEIKTLFLDRNGDLWIGTRKGGLNRFESKTERFSHYTVESGILSNTIASILEDNNGRLWVSTNTGLSIFDRERGKWSNFTIDDGLKNSEFLSESACRMSNGAFLFGGANGYDYIDPELFIMNTYIPEVQITRIRVNGKEIWPLNLSDSTGQFMVSKQEIILPYNIKSLTFQVSALSFTHPEKNRYAYRLLGYNKNWIELGTQRIINLGELQPGSYELQIRSANNDGLWNEIPGIFRIQILPPWWSTLLFRILVAALIFTLLILGMFWKIKYDRRQKQKLEVMIERRTRELEREKKKTEEQNFTLIEIQKKILKQNEEISAQKENIERMSEMARQSDQEKLVFFTNISHEIKTPLSLIIGPLEQMMNDYSLDRNIRNQLSITYRNSLSLLNLVNQIMDFRRIENNKYPYQPEEADIIPLLHEIFISFSQKAQNLGIRFTFSSGAQSIPGMFDTGKIDKIIFNLLSNAFKFTPGGGEINMLCSVEDRDEKEKNLLIEITDTGKGIPLEYQDKIFTRFFQIPDRGNKQKEGTGIGLSLVKSLVEIQNGSISLESVPGKGSRFTIVIPFIPGPSEILKQQGLSEVLIPSEKETEIAAPPSIIIKPDRHRDKPRILICEDHEELLEFLSAQLDPYYRIIKSTDGEDAFAKIRTNMPDLIVSDVMMPRMNGVDLCQAVKKNIETSHIPLILLTARSGIEYKLEGLGAGADDYIYKPFRIDELRARIENLIASRILLRKKFSSENPLKAGELTITSADEEFLAKAINLVENEMSSPSFNVTEFVREMHMSRTLIHTKLKELTDTSASGFIRTLRLKKAALLLTDRKYTVSEVAYLVGFNDPKYFHKCFREQYGITPGEFMEQT